jgi:hypothetical protein
MSQMICTPPPCHIGTCTPRVIFWGCCGTARVSHLASSHHLGTSQLSFRSWLALEPPLLSNMSAILTLTCQRPYPQRKCHISCCGHGIQTPCIQLGLGIPRHTRRWCHGMTTSGRFRRHLGLMLATLWDRGRDLPDMSLALMYMLWRHHCSQNTL